MYSREWRITGLLLGSGSNSYWAALQLPFSSFTLTSTFQVYDVYTTCSPFHLRLLYRINVPWAQQAYFYWLTEGLLNQISFFSSLTAQSHPIKWVFALGPWQTGGQFYLSVGSRIQEFCTKLEIGSRIPSLLLERQHCSREWELDLFLFFFGLGL